MKRFYKEVAAEETPDGFRILLGGRAVRTPGGRMLLLPAAALAEAIAAEWRGQGEAIDPLAMPMLRLANTALDGIADKRGETVAALLRIGAHDLLCYRADGPPELAQRQAEGWDPLLDWAATHLDARLAVTTGIGHVDQPAQAMAALESAVAAEGDFALAALSLAVSVTGSLVLGLAMREGRLTPTEAFRLSRIDEDYQAGKWGRDAEAEARARRMAGEMDVAAAFLAALRS